MCDNFVREVFYTVNRVGVFVVNVTSSDTFELDVSDSLEVFLT